MINKDEERHQSLNDSLETFLSSLKSFRESKGLKEEDVASDLGMTIDELRDFENPSISCPTVYDLIYYADAIDARLLIELY